MELVLVKDKRIVNMAHVKGYGRAGIIPKINLRETCIGDEDQIIYGKFLQDKLDQLIEKAPKSNILWLDWIVQGHESQRQVIEVILGGKLLKLLKEVIYYNRKDLDICLSLRFEGFGGSVAISDAGLISRDPVNKKNYKSCPRLLSRSDLVDNIRVPGSKVISDELISTRWTIIADVKLTVKKEWSRKYILKEMGTSWGICEDKLEGESKEFGMTIRTKDNCCIACHKAVLTAKSPVLAAMLEGERFKEGTTKEIEMGWDSEEIRAFLVFLETGKYREARKSAVMAMKLWEIGDYYDVEMLADIMKCILLEKLINWFSANDAMALYLLGSGRNGDSGKLFMRRAKHVLEMKTMEEVCQAELFPEAMKIKNFKEFFENVIKVKSCDVL